MGMYDTLVTNCPKCGSRISFQSKAGDCSLAEYSIFNVPAQIALDCKEDIEQCPNCLDFVGLQVESMTIVRPYIKPV